jgi:hypothetical protein
MRSGIIPHDHYIDYETVNLLEGFDFVFLCIDNGDARRLIVQKLEQFGTPFIDVGMGINEIDGALTGLVRVTHSANSNRSHVWAKKRIPFDPDSEENEYDRNIQIADLNALNATLAVMKWKRICGFYHDMEGEFFSAYSIGCNSLVNEDQQ